MSNKEVPDIGEMYNFYQLRGEILDNLKQSHEDAITDQDVIDFFNVLAGGECATCNDIDFNNNTVFPEDQDVIDFFRVLAGGTCP
jgi:hypothetical protein